MSCSAEEVSAQPSTGRENMTSDRATREKLLSRGLNRYGDIPQEIVQAGVDHVLERLEAGAELDELRPNPRRALRRSQPLRLVHIAVAASVVAILAIAVVRNYRSNA